MGGYRSKVDALALVPALEEQHDLAGIAQGSRYIEHLVDVLDHSDKSSHRNLN